MIVVRSLSPSLKICFPPNMFGVTEDLLGNKRPLRPIKLVDGSFSTSDEKLIDCLKKHGRNRDVSPNSFDFWIENPEILREEMSAYGKSVVATDDLKLTVDDIQALESLDQSFAVFPADKEKLVETLTYIVDRFLISGIQVPDKGESQMKFIGKMAEVLDLLEKEGIWPFFGSETKQDMVANDRKRSTKAN